MATYIFDGVAVAAKIDGSRDRARTQAISDDSHFAPCFRDKAIGEHPLEEKMV